MTSNPMQGASQLLAMHRSKRCRAKSKRSGVGCKSPAVTGWNVCRMHGARGGAPPGAKNGNYRTGLHTQEAKRDGRDLRSCLRYLRGMLRETP
jgi:hypothetical protein